MKSVRFIAEIGSTHGGSKEECKKAIANAAALCIKDCKFQLLEEEHLKNEDNILLPWDWAKELVDFGKSYDVNVFFSVWSRKGLKVAIDAGCKTIKLAASANPNYIFDVTSISLADGSLGITCTCNLEIIYSSSSKNQKLYMSYSNSKNVKHLFCISEYPVLYKIDFSILKDFDGFSDHTVGFSQTDDAYNTFLFSDDKSEKIIEKHVSQTDCSCGDNRFAVTWDEVKEFLDFKKSRESLIHRSN